MAKGVILKTDEGVKLFGSTQCSNGAWWNAENCFNYCNSPKDDYFQRHQAVKLKAMATSMNVCTNNDIEWYKNADNFVDVDINYEVDQSYVLKKNQLT